MRMRHFEDQWGHFFLGGGRKWFFGKYVFALCTALFCHKKYEENRYRADIKKS